MGESLPLLVLRRVAKAESGAEPARIVGASVDAGSGRIVEAVSDAVVARLSGAALGAVEKALSDAVLGAVVVRVLGLVVGPFSARVSGRVSALVSGADSMLRCGERKKRCFAVLSMTSNLCHSERSEESSARKWPRKHVLRPKDGSSSHEGTKPTKGEMRVGHKPRRPQFLTHETERRCGRRFG
jgi:hypothetical protein